MLEPTSVIIGENRYIVEPFNPSEAFEYMHNLIFARATGRGLMKLGREAIGKCLTSDGRRLEKGDAFDAWFTDHTGDMLELETKAMDALCAPWEIASGHEEKISALIDSLVKEIDNEHLDDMVERIKAAYMDSMMGLESSPVEKLSATSRAISNATMI